MKLAARDNILHLPDGRCLSYAEYGVATGMPVVYCHGAPGSRLSIFADMAETAARCGVHLICVERPGYGLSAARAGHSLLDSSRDVQFLVDALGIGCFRLVGFSGGCPSALACAHALPGRVERVAIVSGLAPMTDAVVSVGMAPMVHGLYELARVDPQALRQVMEPMATSPAGLLAAMAAAAPAVDRSILAAHAQQFEADFAEALRGGIEGIAADFVLAAGAWGFPLADIGTAIDLWIGSEDCNTPPAMTRYLVEALPNAGVHELRGAGHFCLYTHWPQILDRLLA